MLSERTILETEERDLAPNFSVDEKEIIPKWLEDSQKLSQKLFQS
jgi:hypothetical protein